MGCTKYTDEMMMKEKGWKDLPRKNIHVILTRGSAERILREWKDSGVEFDKKKSFHIRGLVKRIERQLSRPKRESPRRKMVK